MLLVLQSEVGYTYGAFVYVVFGWVDCWCYPVTSSVVEIHSEEK